MKRQTLLISLCSIQVTTGLGEITLASMALTVVLSGIVLRLVRAGTYLSAAVPEDQSCRQEQAYVGSQARNRNLAASVRLLPWLFDASAHGKRRRDSALHPGCCMCCLHESAVSRLS